MIRSHFQFFTTVFVMFIVLYGCSSCELKNKKKHNDIQSHNSKGFSQHEQNLLSKETTPLIKAVNASDLVEVKRLIKADADVNEAIGSYAEAGGLTPLMVAARNADLDIMKELIAAGADVNEIAWRDQPHAGKPVLWYAIDSGAPEAVNVLIQAGANPNVYTENPIIIKSRAQANSRNLPVLSAAINSYAPITVIKELISGGANVNYSGPLTSWTPLMVAAYRGYTDAVNELLRAGADPALKNKQDDNRMALDYAKEEGNKNIIKILKK